MTEDELKALEDKLKAPVVPMTKDAMYEMYNRILTEDARYCFKCLTEMDSDADLCKNCGTSHEAFRQAFTIQTNLRDWKDRVVSEDASNCAARTQSIEGGVIDQRLARKNGKQKKSPLGKLEGFFIALLLFFAFTKIDPVSLVSFLFPESLFGGSWTLWALKWALFLGASYCVYRGIVFLYSEKCAAKIRSFSVYSRLTAIWAGSLLTLTAFLLINGFSGLGKVSDQVIYFVIIWLVVYLVVWLVMKVLFPDINTNKNNMEFELEKDNKDFRVLFFAVRCVFTFIAFTLYLRFAQ